MQLFLLFIKSSVSEQSVAMYQTEKKKNEFPSREFYYGLNCSMCHLFYIKAVFQSPFAR